MTKLYLSQWLWDKYLLRTEEIFVKSLYLLKVGKKHGIIFHDIVNKDIRCLN